MTVLRVLIVDDDLSILRLMSRLLEGAGYQVRLASCLSDARACLETESFDLFILDFWLGSENGLDVMRALRMAQPDAPVLFLSGGNQGIALETTTALAEMQGAAEFLYKPVSNLTLLEAVRRHIG